MNKLKLFVMGILLFVSPILFRILFDEGEKIEINTPKTLDKIKDLW